MSNKIGECKLCGQNKRLTRGYCATKCYVNLIRKGILHRLPKLTSPATLTSIQEETLIGLLLGDGCLFIHKNSDYPYLSVVRKIDDKQYLESQFDIFKDFCNIPIKEFSNLDKRTNKTYYRCRMLTRPSSAFMPYYKSWYNKKKHVPKNLILTPLICAGWFCDDGCITIQKTKRLCLKLSTHGFLKKDNYKLQSMLKNLFKEHFSISKDKKHCYITAADAGAKAFIKYIEPHIPISMKRKIKWNKIHFDQPKSRPQIKNRNQLDVSEKGKQILIALIQKPLSPKQISEKIGWINKKSSCAPSGIHLYLNRFYNYKWIDRIGKHHSQTNGIKYCITNTGQSILEKLNSLSIPVSSILGNTEPSI